jgi:hypothetical protein
MALLLLFFAIFVITVLSRQRLGFELGEARSRFLLLTLPRFAFSNGCYVSLFLTAFS